MRVFLDFTEGPRTTRDLDGQDCDGPEQARIEVLKALPEVLLSDFRDTDAREVACSVRDEGGAVLYRARVTLEGRRSSGR